MRKNSKLFFLFLFLSINLSHAQEVNLWGDFKTSFKYLYKGAGKQFQEKNNLYYLAAAIPLNWYAFEHDERITKHMMGKELDGPTEAIGELGSFFTFPFFSYAIWQIGSWQGNRRTQQFAMEYMAAMYIALFESGILSYIDIHQRPKMDDLSFWETAFRGNSSWPSGHLIPYSTLIFKTFQFYGPYWTLIPVGLTYIAARQRMIDGKHWFSDLMASLFLSAFASEGVRAVANYDQNHPLYKWIFEYELKISLIRFENAWGPRVSFSF